LVLKNGKRNPVKVKVSETGRSRPKIEGMGPWFRKTRVFKKAQPTGFWGFYWLFAVFGLYCFSDFLFERAVGKLGG